MADYDGAYEELWAVEKERNEITSRRIWRQPDETKTEEELDAMLTDAKSRVERAERWINETTIAAGVGPRRVRG